VIGFVSLLSSLALLGQPDDAGLVLRPPAASISTIELAVGRNLLFVGRPEEARRVFSDLSERYPESVAAHLGLIESLIQLREYEACEGVIARSRWPELRDVKRAKASLYMATERNHEGIQLLESCIEAPGAGAATDLLDLAEGERRLGRWDRALRHYQEFLALDPLAAEERPDVKANLDSLLAEHKPQLSFAWEHSLQARSARISHLSLDLKQHCSREVRFHGAAVQTIGHRPGGNDLFLPINEAITSARVGFGWEPRPSFRARGGVRGYAGGLNVGSLYGDLRWTPTEKTELTLAGDLYRMNDDVVDFLAVGGTYHEVSLTGSQEFLRFGFVRARGALRRYQYDETRFFGTAGNLEGTLGVVLRHPLFTARTGYTFYYFESQLEDNVSLESFDPLFQDGVSEADRRAYIADGLVPARVKAHGAAVELTGTTGWRRLEWGLTGGFRYDLVPSANYWNVGGTIRYHPIRTLSLGGRYEYWSADPTRGGGATTEFKIEVIWWF